MPELLGLQHFGFPLQNGVPSQIGSHGVVLVIGQCMCPKWVKDIALLGLLNITALGAQMNGLFMFVLSVLIFFNEIRTYCKTCQRWQLHFAWFSHEALISAYLLFNFLSFVCRIGLSRQSQSRPYRPERCLSQDDVHVQIIFFAIWMFPKIVVPPNHPF